MENPKPNQTPMDSAKPALMWIQASFALIAALMLSWTAVKQLASTTELDLPLANEPDRYGRVSRILHWTTAILFISLFPIGMFASMIPEDTWFRNQYYVVHKTIGVLVFALLLVRLVWNRRSKRPELDPSLKPTERKWAHRVHILLYLMLIAPLWGESDAYIIWGTFHKYLLPYLLYIVLGAHILGALKHHFIDRHSGALKRMVA